MEEKTPTSVEVGAQKVREMQDKKKREEEGVVNTPEMVDEMIKAHMACVRAIHALPYCEDRQAVVESVARFMGVSVEPSITEVASMGVQLLASAFDAYKGEQAPQGTGMGGDQVTGGQGKESLVSLLAKMQMMFPEEKRVLLRNYVVELFHSCYDAPPSSSEEPGQAPGPR